MTDLPLEQRMKMDHIFRLTDDTGMLQHSKYALPDPRHGYTTDDNARALIMALLLYGQRRERKTLDLVYRYASFLLNAQNDQGTFKNFMAYDRKWLEEEGSEDCFGRCMWALGFALSNPLTPPGVRGGLGDLLKKALPNGRVLKSPRAKAYTILGLAHLPGAETEALLLQLAQSLVDQYAAFKDGEWKWFEDIVTYCNFVLPWALLSAYRVTGDGKFFQVAEESLDFLSGITFQHGYFHPVGCNGWFSKGGHRADFDQQPVEACEGVLTFLEAYGITGKREYLQKAQACHRWYTGANSKGIPLVDHETGGCYDGLTQEGVNLNMGAESLISYVISAIKISEVSGLRE